MKKLLIITAACSTLFVGLSFLFPAEYRLGAVLLLLTGFIAGLLSGIEIAKGL